MSGKPALCLLTVYAVLCVVLSMPDSVEEMCSEVPRLDRLLKDINDISESGARYTEMPQVRRAWTVFHLFIFISPLFNQVG